MAARASEPALMLIAPTGGGKTMAGFLPTLAELVRRAITKGCTRSMSRR